MTQTSCNILGHDVAGQLGEHLQASLVDLIAIASQAKQAHWNVTGQNFRELHQQFDELVDVARDVADEIAERMAAIGVSPDGRAVTVVNNSTLMAMPNGFLRDRQAVEVLCGSLDKTCRTLRSRIETVGGLDLVSQDVLISGLRGLEKQFWMLRTRLEEPR
ncbi:MAG: DNA starvation/stationary phase protection protein [Fimbriimonadaceae bacterium]|nr:DNA starvation/stationary phase protection protein [Fimbriimonadaceae bacterium]